MPPPPIPPPVAYSYLRFSRDEQRRGDSTRRQDELAADWSERRGIPLDGSLSLRDMGRSAFTGKHRENPERHALARFLQLVEEGRVRRGSYLVVENLDRLSREHILPALSLLLGLIQSGIRVVQLMPVETVFDESVEPMTLMLGCSTPTRTATTPPWASATSSRRRRAAARGRWRSSRPCSAAARPGGN